MRDEIIKYKLNNELNVCIRNLDHFENVISMALVVNTGSSSEKDNCKGIAHFLEHILMSYYTFNLVSDINCRTKAYTDFNETIFYLRCSNNLNDIKKCLEIYLNIAQGKYIEDRFLDRAKNDVLEEIKERKLGSSVIDALLDQSEYLNILSIGNERDVKHIGIQELKNFYNQNYSSNIMTLVIVGDVDNIFDLKKCVEAIFTKVKNREIIRKPIKRITIPAYKKKIVNCSEKGGKDSNIEIYLKINRQELEKHDWISIEILENISNQLMIKTLREGLGKRKLLIKNINCSWADLDMSYLFYVVNIEITQRNEYSLTRIVDKIEEVISDWGQNIVYESILKEKKKFYHIERDKWLYYESMGMKQLLSEVVNSYILKKPVYSYEEKCNLYENKAKSMSVEDIVKFLEWLEKCERLYYIT